MFGFPAYYVGKKLCICLYEQGVGVKLPEASAARLLEVDQNVIPFQPLEGQRCVNGFRSICTDQRITDSTSLCLKNRSGMCWGSRRKGRDKFGFNRYYPPQGGTSSMV